MYKKLKLCIIYLFYYIIKQASYPLKPHMGKKLGEKRQTPFRRGTEGFYNACAQEQEALREQQARDRVNALLEECRKRKLAEEKKQADDAEAKRKTDAFEKDKAEANRELEALSSSELATRVLQITRVNLVRLRKKLMHSSSRVWFPSDSISQLLSEIPLSNHTPMVSACFDELHKMALAMWTTITRGRLRNHKGKHVCICKSALCSIDKCGFPHAKPGDIFFGESVITYSTYCQAWICIERHKFVALNLWADREMFRCTAWTLEKLKKFLRVPTEPGCEDTRFSHGCLGVLGNTYGEQVVLPFICENPSVGHLCDTDHDIESSTNRAYANIQVPYGVRVHFLHGVPLPVFGLLNMFGDSKNTCKITPARLINKAVGLGSMNVHKWSVSFYQLAVEWLGLPITASWHHATEAIRVAVNSVAPSVWDPTEVVSMLLMLKHLLRGYIALLPLYHERYPHEHDHYGCHATEWRIFEPVLDVAHRVPGDVASMVCSFL